MPVLSTEGSERKTDRLEAFSDAVLAIAITLPLVELRAPEVPQGGDIAGAYAGLASHYLAYALDFTVIGLYWAHSLFSGKIIRSTDHGFNLLTLLFLASVSITPFPSLPFLDHFDDEVSGRTAAIVYGGVLTLPTILWFGRWLYAVRRRLLDPHLAPAYVRRLTTRHALAAVASLTGLSVTAFGSWHVGMGIIGLVVLSYLAPPLVPEFKRGEEPEHELEEADDREV